MVLLKSNGSKTRKMSLHVELNHKQLTKKILNDAEIACKDNEKIQASLSIKSLGFDVYMKPL